MPFLAAWAMWSWRGAGQATIELVVSDDGIGMQGKGSAETPEKRGSDYVAIFVRQLGGTIVPLILKEGSGTTVKVRLPFLLVPPGQVDSVAA